MKYIRSTVSSFDFQMFENHGNRQSTYDATYSDDEVGDDENMFLNDHFQTKENPLYNNDQLSDSTSEPQKVDYSASVYSKIRRRFLYQAFIQWRIRRWSRQLPPIQNKSFWAGLHFILFVLD